MAFPARQVLLVCALVLVLVGAFAVVYWLAPVYRLAYRGKPYVVPSLFEERPCAWIQRRPPEDRDHAVDAFHDRASVISTRELTGRPEVDVIGDNGVIFTVGVAATCTCTCPTAQRSGTMCKHIMFVKEKVLRIPPSHPLSWQRGYTASEVQYMHLHHSTAGVMALPRIIHAVTDNTMQRHAHDAKCLVCQFTLMEDMEADDLTSCKRFEAFIHSPCAGDMCRFAEQRGMPMQCPACRGQWAERSPVTVTTVVIEGTEFTRVLL